MTSGYKDTLALRSHRLDVNDMTVNEATVKNETESVKKDYSLSLF